MVFTLDPRDPQTREAIRWLCDSSGLPMSQAIASLAAEHVQAAVRSELRLALAPRRGQVTA
jgi:hypothetical protein